MEGVVRIFFGSAVALFAIACGGNDPSSGSTTPPAAVPSAILISPSSSVTLDALQATQSISATVTAANGGALADAVTWLSDAPSIVSVSGSGTSATVTSVANGAAHITARTSNGIASSPLSVTVQQVATKLARVSGDAQAGVVNTKLTAPLVVLALDRNDNAVSNAGVTYSASAGTLASATATSGANGQASNTWTLSTVAGALTVNVSLTSTPASIATFTATATPGPAQRLLKIDGDAQRGTVSATLAAPLIAAVVDQFGNGVSGVVVALAAQAGSGSVSPVSVISNATGQAQAVWTLGATASSSQVVTGTAAGLSGSPLSFTATALNASLDNLGPTPFKGGCKISGILSGVIVADKSHISITVNGVSLAQTDFTLVAAGSSAVILTITVPTLSLTKDTVVPIVVRVYSQNVQPSLGTMTYSPTASC